MKRTDVRRYRSVIVLVAVLAGLLVVPPTSAQAPVVRVTAMVANPWTMLPPLGSTALNAISMRSTTDGWIVGDQGLTWHWNGTEWLSVTTPVTNDLNSVAVVPGTDEAWAVGGEATILHFAGGTWTKVAPDPTVTAQLDAVSMVSATDGWIVGDSGVVMHWNGTAWTRVLLPGVTVQLHHIQMLSATEGWMVGAKGFIAHYQNGTWTQVQPGLSGASLYSVAMLSPTDGWISGDPDPDKPGNPTSTILHWNGTAWSRVASPVTTRLWFAAGNQGSDVWAVGNGGTILRYADGAWSQILPAPTTQPLYAVTTVGPSDGWIIGGAGTLMRLTGTTPPPVQQDRFTYLPGIWTKR